MSDTDFIPPSSVDSSSATKAISEPWRSLVGQIGAEVAGPLTAALERIHVLTGTGRIDRRGLRALRNEVDAARQVGLVTQQIARLASGDLHQAPERLQLVPILKGVFAQRSRDIEARGLQIRQQLQPADIIADAPLLFGLLNTMLDWTLANARSHVEFKTDIKSWPAHARLSANFAHSAPGPGADVPPASGLDSLIWRLLQHTAASMGLNVTRHVDGAHTELVIEFPKTIEEAPLVSEPPIAPAPVAAAAPLPPVNLKPLIGSHVLVAAAQRGVRLQVRESIKNMGLIVDFVNSIEEAADFCKDGLPHAIVFEATLRGPVFDTLKAELATEVPDFVFIEIADRKTEPIGNGINTVPEDSIASTLPGVLAAELSRTI